MIGIKSYGAYLPKYLLPRELIAKAWDFPIVPGTKAFCAADEDSLTMGVEAGLDCLTDIDPKTIDGLFFASTTAPYTEKSTSSFIAAVLDLRDNIITADFTDSTKAGTSAICRAVDAIKSNKDIKSILVIAADTRAPEPATFWEYGFADGAAAVLIAEEETLALSIEDYYSISANTTGPWKRYEKDRFIRTFEPKMDAKIYLDSITKAMAELLKKNNLKSENIDTAVYSYNDPRAQVRISRMMKFPQGVAQNGTFFQLGDFGTAMPLILLISALRRPKDDAKILMAGYGDGADAILLQVRGKKEIREVGKKVMGVVGHQKSMTTVKNYDAYIDNKELLEKDRYTRKSSATILWRDTKSLYQWYGNKCTKCGTIQYPMMFPSCYECRSYGTLQPHKLKMTGTIFTFTLDHLVGGNYYDTPVPRCVIDLDGGGRVLLDMTEIQEPQKNVKIGDRIEMVFRKVHEGAEFKNYYWKCRPPRGKS
jgi:hydroxymethylglutaryl-CoA synthase